MNTRKSIKILLVDDNMQNLQVLGNLLETEGYQTEFALSGEEALNWIEDDFFDLILLDVMMPEMDGFEVCTEIRKNIRYNDVPVIFLTAKTDTYSTIKGFQLKAQDYITKPFERNELLARINTQIELKESKDLLKNMNQILEEKVTARTQELTHAHQTLQRTNEQLEAANAELLELDDSKNKFLHLLSHELRTPLNGMLGAIDLLKHMVQDEEMQLPIGILDTSFRRLHQLSLDAILLTTIKIKSYPLRYQDFDLASILEDVTSQQTKKFPEKNITFTYRNISEGLILHSDAYLLTEVLNRLIENAIVFSDEAPQVEVIYGNKPDGFELTILDHGPGFPDKMLNKDLTLLKPGDEHIDQNIGLDLYLVNLIMETLNGDLKFGNSSHAGAYVTIGINS